MPHAVYLHSGLTQARIPARNASEKRKIVRISNTEVIVALAVAGMVNMAMVMMASSAFHAGHSDVAEIETAYHTLTPLLGGAAASVFLVSLLASGVSSSTVGTLAGQMIMQGFVGFRIPIWVRRLVTMLPAFVVVGLGANATNALVISQVVLSIALPLPMIALIIFTRRRDIMGAFANGTAHQCRGDRRHGRRVAAQHAADLADVRRAGPRVVQRGLGAHAMPRAADHIDVRKTLTKIGMRPTRQRVALASLLLAGEHGPVTAEILYQEARAAGCSVSRATVCLALRQFEQAGLLRRFTVPGSRKAWFVA